MTPDVTATVEGHLSHLGASLLESQLVGEDPTELTYVVLWSRPTSMTQYPTEWGTHRAVIRRDATDSMLVSGHYFFLEPYAREDFQKRAGRRGVTK